MIPFMLLGDHRSLRGSGALPGSRAPVVRQSADRLRAGGGNVPPVWTNWRTSPTGRGLGELCGGDLAVAVRRSARHLMVCWDPGSCAACMDPFGAEVGLHGVDAANIRNSVGGPARAASNASKCWRTLGEHDREERAGRGAGPAHGLTLRNLCSAPSAEEALGADAVRPHIKTGSDSGLCGDQSAAQGSQALLPRWRRCATAASRLRLAAHR